jgi:hypothetical protein
MQKTGRVGRRCVGGDRSVAALRKNVRVQQEIRPKGGVEEPTLDQQHLESHRNPGGATNMIGQGDGAVVMSVLFVE